MYVYYEDSDNLSEDSVSRLKENGINCVNKDNYNKTSVDEGCNKKNPIKEMKKNPETVNVAATDEGYFVSGSDLITYMEAAEIDDVAEALNNIIESYDDFDIDADNIHVMLDENSEYLRSDLEDIGLA